MTVLDITILNTRVQFGCEPDEENSVRHTAYSLNQRLENLRGERHNVADVMVFATALMLMEDEIRTLREKLGAPGEIVGNVDEAAVVQTIQAFRDYIDALADKYARSLAQT